MKIGSKCKFSVLPRRPAAKKCAAHKRSFSFLIFFLARPRTQTLMPCYELILQRKAERKQKAVISLIKSGGGNKDINKPRGFFSLLPAS